MTVLTATIPQIMAGMRLDRCLVAIFPHYSRSLLQVWIKAGRVTVNNVSLKAKDKVAGGERVEVRVKAEKVLENRAENIALDCVYEDDSILIINKPAGLVVHPAVGHWQGTLVNALLYHHPDLKNLPRAGIVHRLDKGTSGLIMVAKTLPAQQSLSAQLKDRTIIREYLAVVRGWMTAGGTVDEPIGRHSIDRKRNIVREDGKSAVTHYRLGQRFAQHTQIKVKLETGRTHQIRVHMAHIHYPLLGDRVYGGRFQMSANCSETLAVRLREFNRPALHAAKLGLNHPISNEYCEWEQEMPEDMTKLLKALAKNDVD